MVYKPTKYVNTKYEKAKSRYPSKKLKPDTLKKFIYDKSLPLVGFRGYKSDWRYHNQKLPLLTVFTEVDFVKNNKGYQYIATRLRYLIFRIHYRLEGL